MILITTFTNVNSPIKAKIRKNKTKLNKHRVTETLDFAFVPEEDEEYSESEVIVKRKNVESNDATKLDTIMTSSDVHLQDLSHN